jgi:hypothetical protein
MLKGQVSQATRVQRGAIMYRTLAAILFTVALSASSQGADYHILPQGAGLQDGSDWDNAAPPVALRKQLAESVQPGDRILLGSGVHAVPRNPGSNTVLPVPRGGTAEAPITVLGVDTGGGRPTIAGRWRESNPRYHAHSAACFAFAPGVSHVVIEGLRIVGFMQGVTTSGDNRNLKFKSLAFQRCREGFTLQGLADSGIEDCAIIGYTKRGVRFESGCQRLTLTRVSADATGGDEAWPVERYPFGFSIEGDPTNRDIRYVACTARNNLYRCEPDEYWNGDGFTAESGAAGVCYERCLAVDNMDGGWDDKSTAPTLVDCIAVGNKRAIRIWNVEGDAEHPARLINCIGAYSRTRGGIGSTAGLWTCGYVVAERCTFHNNPAAAVAVANNGRAGHAILRDGILSRDAADADAPLVTSESDTTCQQEDIVLWQAGSQADDPDFAADRHDWKGCPVDALNSRRYGPSQGAWREKL